MREGKTKNKMSRFLWNEMVFECAWSHSTSKTKKYLSLMTHVHVLRAAVTTVTFQQSLKVNYPPHFLKKSNTSKP